MDDAGDADRFNYKLEAMEKLLEARVQALHNEIESLRVLKDHDVRAIEIRFEESKKALDVTLVMSNEAVRRSEAAVENRFASVNEFRATLSDQASHFVTRTEYDAGHLPIVQRLDEVSKPNITVWISFGTMFAFLLSGAFIVIQLKIDASNGPLAANMVQTQQSAADSQHRIAELQMVTAKQGEQLINMVTQSGSDVQRDMQLSDLQQKVAAAATELKTLRDMLLINTANLRR
jgi:hypothetical protein